MNPWEAHTDALRRELEERDRLSDRFRGAQMVQVIRVITGEGLGTPGSVFRQVTRYVDPESGKVLAVDDPFPDGRAPA